jgi:hypothetical protein
MQFFVRVPVHTPPQRSESTNQRARPFRTIIGTKRDMKTNELRLDGLRECTDQDRFGPFFRVIRQIRFIVFQRFS